MGEREDRYRQTSGKVNEAESINTLHSPEEPGIFHIICIFIVLLLRTDPHPEEVLWLLSLINHLGDKFMKIHFHAKSCIERLFFFFF